MRFLSLLVILATLFWSSEGLAQTKHHSPYFSLGLGMTQFADADFKSVPNPSTNTFENGYLARGALGVDYGYQNGWPRFELELAHRMADLDTATFTGAELQAGGTLTLTTLMANVYLDLPVSKTVKPYLMAGGGGAWVGLEDYTLNGIPASASDRVEDDVLAGQAGIGLGLRLGSLTYLDLGYRFLRTEDAEFEDTIIEVASHAAILNLRIHLY